MRSAKGEERPIRITIGKKMKGYLYAAEAPTDSPYRPASFTSFDICRNLSVPASPNSSKRTDSQVVILAPS